MKYRIRKKENHVSGTTYYFIDCRRYWFSPWMSTGQCYSKIEEAKATIDRLIKENKGTETITIIKYP